MGDAESDHCGPNEAEKAEPLEEEKAEGDDVPAETGVNMGKAVSVKSETTDRGCRGGGDL